MCCGEEAGARNLVFFRVKWLHQSCGIDLSADFLHFGARDFPFKSPCKKVLENCLFCALASRSGFGAAMSDAVARSSIVSFADRIGTAA